MSVPTLNSYATRLATALDDRSGKFRAGSIIHDAQESGYSLDEIATAIGKPAARRAFPGADDAVIDRLAATPKSKGGFAMSKSSVAVYAVAWRVLDKAGIEHSESLYSLAFRLVTRTGSSEARDALIDAVAAVTGKNSDLVQAERATMFVTGASDIVTGLNAQRREVKSETAPATPKSKGEPATKTPKTPDQVAGIPDSTINMAGASAGKRTSTPAVVPVSVEVALETIRRIAVQTWSPADRERLTTALLEAAELIDTPVEVVTPA